MEDLGKNYSVTYQNDLQRSYMVIETNPNEEIIEYQARIMQENPEVQLLAFHKKQIDDNVYLYYDITSKIPLAQLLKRKSFSKHEFLSLVKSILSALKLSNSYLLQEGTFIFENELIYVDPATFVISIAYMPIRGNQDISKVLGAWLTDLLIFRVNFAPPSEGDFAYQLLKFLKSEDFDLAHLDSTLDKLALQQTASAKDNALKKSDPKREVQVSERPVLKEMHKNKEKLVVVISQVFFLALAGFLIKYFFSRGIEMDISKIAGIFVIIVGIDILAMKRLKQFPREDEVIKSKKTTEIKKQPRTKKERKLKSNGLYSNAKKEIAAVRDMNRYFNPRELETKVLMQVDKPCPFLVGIGEGLPEKILIDRPSFLFGRLKNQSDYISPNHAVGKLHAEIITRGSSCYLKDLNSRNGTYINGERIVSNVEYSLHNNDRISFANSEYKFIWS